MTTIMTKRMPTTAPAMAPVLLLDGASEAVIVVVESVVGGSGGGIFVAISPVKESKILVTAISMAKNRN